MNKKAKDALALAFGEEAIIPEDDLLEFTSDGAMESLVHELSHAEVLGVKPTSSLVSSIHLAHDRFNSYDGDMQRLWNKRRASDLSECATLAVELLALKDLGIYIERGELEKYASGAMSKMKLEEVPSAVDRALAWKVTKKRAVRVVRWVKDALSDVEGT